MTPAPPPKPPSKERQEWDEFWGAVECCMRLQASPLLHNEEHSYEDRASKKVRTARCGSCAGCVRGDCGDCKNCLDKPKFGGRGIKKQACLQRVCCNPQEETADESPGISPNLGPTKKEGFYSADPSPHPREFATSDASPPLLELPGASPDGHASSRGYAGSGKKVSFADDAEGGEASRGRVLSDSAEAVGYSTDEEEEAAAQPPPPSSPQRVPSRIHEAAAAMCAAAAGSGCEYGRPHASPDENRPVQRSAQRSEREEGAAEALMLAGCPSSQQLPLMLLLSAGTAR